MLNAEWAFLRHLFEIGRETASEWLEKNFDNLGKRSSINIREMFDGFGRLPDSERASEPESAPVEVLPKRKPARRKKTGSAGK